MRNSSSEIKKPEQKSAHMVFQFFLFHFNCAFFLELLFHLVYKKLLSMQPSTKISKNRNESWAEREKNGKTRTLSSLMLKPQYSSL